MREKRNLTTNTDAGWIQFAQYRSVIKKPEKNADVFGSYSTKTEKHADCIEKSAKALN